MRNILAALLLFLVPAGVHAQAPQITRIDVREYGIYTADMTRTAVTRTIPAQRGVRFGFLFVVIGDPAGAIVPLRTVTIIPSPGLRDPSTQQVRTQNEHDANAHIGNSNFLGYSFDNNWELVPGIWTMQVWHQGRKLAEQTFKVVEQ
jgi:hypothetical protein